MTNFTRRDFLKIGAAGTATAILAGCSQESERYVTLEPYVHAPDQQVTGRPSFYATTCRMCPAACGIVARIVNGRAVLLEGNPEHPVSRGKICARGQAGVQLLYNPDRVTGAVAQERRGSNEYQPIAWNEALNSLHDRLSDAGSQVGIWLGSTTSGHLADLFARFAEAIGAPPPVHYDLYSAFHGYDPLMAANGMVFDTNQLPTYDIGNADAVFSFGADFLGTWLSATGYGVEFGHFRSQDFGKRGFLVQFEPKMSITGAKADRWLPVKPGMEATVAQALIAIIAEEELGPEERVSRARALATEVDIEAAAAACATEPETLHTLARVFAEAERPLALPGSTVTGLPNGAEAAAAIQALNAVAGTTGEAGALRFTPPVPVDGLAPKPVSAFADAQALLDRMRNGDVRVLLVHGANPAYDLPTAADYLDATLNVETIVSFNPLVDETGVHADYILPDRVYLEGWGYDVVAPAFGGKAVISGQQPVVGPFHDVRPTGDVLLTVARGLPDAASALPWTDEVAFIKETISQLPEGATGGTDPDVRWARFQQYGGWWHEPDATTAITPTVNAAINVPEATFQGSDDEYPYHLHLFMNVLLGDGSGAAMPFLQGAPDPLTTISWQTWVEVNPTTAEELDLDRGDVVKIISPHGEIEAPVFIFPAIRPDTIAIPLGQGHEDYGRYAKERGVNPLHLVGTETSADARHLAWSNIRVRIEKQDEKQEMAIFGSTIDPGENAHSPI